MSTFILPGYALDERKDPGQALGEKVAAFTALLEREKSVVSGRKMDATYWRERGIPNVRMVASFVVPHFFLALLSSSKDAEVPSA